MTKPEEPTPPHGEEATDQARNVEEIARPHMSIFGIVIRLVARLWVTSLLLLAAAFGGIAVNAYFQEQSELTKLREEPGPDAYAVVAYRRELERQVRAYERDYNAEAVPAPPPRPRLMEEIDLTRPRERERAPRSTELAPISAPQ